MLQPCNEALTCGAAPKLRRVVHETQTVGFLARAIERDGVKWDTHGGADTILGAGVGRTWIGTCAEKANGGNT